MEKYAFLGGLFETVQQYSKDEVIKNFPIVVKYMKIFDRMERDRVISKGKFKRVKKVELDYLNSPFFDFFYFCIFKDPYNWFFYECKDKYEKWLKNKTLTFIKPKSYITITAINYNFLNINKGSIGVPIF